MPSRERQWRFELEPRLDATPTGRRGSGRANGRGGRSSCKSRGRGIDTEQNVSTSSFTLNFGDGVSSSGDGGSGDCSGGDGGGGIGSIACRDGDDRSHGVGSEYMSQLGSLDLESLCAMVPSLPQDLVRDVWLQQSEAGNNAQQLSELLLALAMPTDQAEAPSAALEANASNDDGADCALSSADAVAPTNTTANTTANTNVNSNASTDATTTSTTDATTTSASAVSVACSSSSATATVASAVAPTAAASPAQSRVRERTALASLPDEVFQLLVAQIGFSALGSLALVCFETSQFVQRWVRQEVTSLTVGSRALRGWSDERVLQLLRVSSELRSLTVDGRERELAFSAFGALLRLQLGRSLGSLQLRSCDALAPAHVMSLPHALQQLKSLALHDCEGLTDEAAAHLVCCANLTSLSLAGNAQLSRALLQQLLKRLPRLERANFDFCAGARKSARKSDASSCLHAGERAAVRRAVSHAIRLGAESEAVAGSLEARIHADEAAAKLLCAAARSTSSSRDASSGWDSSSVKDLSLRGWQSMTTFKLRQSPRLLSLDLSRCAHLTSIDLEVPALLSFTASNCSALVDVTLASCAGLSAMQLSQSKALRTVLAAQSCAIEQLNAFGCRSLSAESVSAILDVSGASLAHLDLNGTLCTASLTEDDIRRRCPQLCHLDVRGRAAKF
uniref:F-box domain-containing protein n=1 Tax=Chrysotila carterae TaxID=13221 RepID=A0A7S4BWY1_CHRCT